LSMGHIFRRMNFDITNNQIYRITPGVKRQSARPAGLAAWL
jgi:hypothetical protein